MVVVRFRRKFTNTHVLGDLQTPQNPIINLMLVMKKPYYDLMVECVPGLP